MYDKKNCIFNGMYRAHKYIKAFINQIFCFVYSLNYLIDVI